MPVSAIDSACKYFFFSICAFFFLVISAKFTNSWRFSLFFCTTGLALLQMNANLMAIHHRHSALQCQKQQRRPNLSRLSIADDNNLFADLLQDQLLRTLPQMLPWGGSSMLAIPLNDINRNDRINNNEMSLNNLKCDGRNCNTNGRNKCDKRSKRFSMAVSEMSEPNTSVAPLSPPLNRASPAGSPKSTSPANKPYQCKTCNRSFGYKYLLRNHVRTHTGEKPYSCKKCDKRFTQDHHLKTHIRLHTGERPYHCNYCSRQFVQVAHLRRHERVHTRAEPDSWLTCKSKFADLSQLKLHRDTHQDKPQIIANDPTNSDEILSDKKSDVMHSDEAIIDLSPSKRSLPKPILKGVHQPSVHARKQQTNGNVSDDISVQARKQQTNGDVSDDILPLDLTVSCSGKRKPKREPHGVLSESEDESDHLSQDLSMSSPRTVSPMSDDEIDVLDDNAL